MREAMQHWSAGTDGDSPGMAMAIAMLNDGLVAIAKHAQKSNDTWLLQMCERLGYVVAATEEAG
jgi:hypothetical protein